MELSALTAFPGVRLCGHVERFAIVGKNVGPE
jgi:hypothetical protein